MVEWRSTPFGPTQCPMAFRRCVHILLLGLEADGNDSGEISEKELGALLFEFGEAKDWNFVEIVFSEFDVDNDGVINYEEFVKMMMAK